MKVLHRLEPGQEGLLVRNDSPNRRFRDLGLVEGTRVGCVLCSPLGDPKAYRVRGALIAIRKEDAEMMAVEPCTR